MGYAELTRNDPNTVKRWLQRKRLTDAATIAFRFSVPKYVLDFGGGDGELCKSLAAQLPHAEIYCYEPAGTYHEAVENLRDTANVQVVAKLDALPARPFDLIFCAEVFEHLPDTEMAAALDGIESRLADDGYAVIGVPLELYAPALIKGAFRMLRRNGEFDARADNVLSACLGFPPKQRPQAEIAPTLAYYPHHLGFDHRAFEKKLRRWFDVVDTVGSPFKNLKSWLNSELYFVVRKRTARPC